jgi:hypothetical protein
MDDEMERNWKDAAFLILRYCPRNSPGRTEDNHERFQSRYPVSGPRFEPETS